MPGGFPFNDIVKDLPNFPHRPLWHTRAAATVTELFIHHAAGGEDQTPAQINRVHHHRNFGTPQKPAYAPRITYHYLIATNGTQYKTNLGLDVTWHCPGHNRIGLSVCLIGNREEISPSEAQWDSLVALSRSLLESYPIRIHSVFLHRDSISTLCPGKTIDRDKLRHDITLSRTPEGGSRDG